MTILDEIFRRDPKKTAVGGTAQHRNRVEIHQQVEGRLTGRTA